MARQTIRVSVDLSAPVSARSQVGFLHGLTADQPADRWIRPLRPALWRGTPSTADIDRALGFGARYVFVLSDLWGYPGERWRGRRPPWEDLAAWSKFVRDTVRPYVARAIVWEVWNEPNHAYFWSGTVEQYRQTYLAAWRAVREVAGRGAVVAGPSVAGFQWAWFASLVDLCRRERCDIGALTWHELSEGGGFTRIGRHTHALRSDLFPVLRAAGLPIPALQVNECVGVGDRLSAGEHVAYLARLERAGVDASARACWRDPCGEDTCSNYTLGGLLDHATLQPRASWWAVKWYARGVPRRVRLVSNADEVAGVAAAHTPDRRHAEVLLGYADLHEGAQPARISVAIRMRGLGKLSSHATPRRARVEVFRVRGEGEASARPARDQPSNTVRIRRGTAQVTVDDIALHDAVLVRVAVPPATR